MWGFDSLPRYGAGRLADGERYTGGVRWRGLPRSPCGWSRNGTTPAFHAGTSGFDPRHPLCASRSGERRPLVRLVARVGTGERLHALVAER
jgi:hypothetical protein